MSRDNYPGKILGAKDLLSMLEIALAFFMAKCVRMSTSLVVVDFSVKVICHKKAIFIETSCGKPQGGANKRLNAENQADFDSSVRKSRNSFSNSF
jgi:hypothetical protein